ncbi:MAG: type II secretion system F family protein [Pseudomonadota bacterium]
MSDLLPTSYIDVAVYILVFTAYFMVMEVMFVTVSRRMSGRDAVNRRLGQYGNGTSRANTADLVDQVGHHQSAIAPKRSGWGPQFFLRLSEQAGVKWRLITLVSVLLLPPAVAMLTAFVLTRSLLAAATIALLVAAAFPLLFLLVMRTRRIQKFESQLPDALDTIVRSIRAGHPLPASIQMVVREFDNPIGEEFAKAGDELTYGLDMEAAMRNMNSRLQQHDLALVVSAISIQSKSGGNLSEILSNLASVVRERTRMRMKVRAMSAEGRLSAVVLSLLPIVVFFVLSVTAPAYYGEIWQYGIVYPIFIAAGIWMMIGNFIMWHLVSFEI